MYQSTYFIYYIVILFQGQYHNSFYCCDNAFSRINYRKKPSKKPRLHCAGGLCSGSLQTRIVSSPMTSISSQQTRKSSSRPNSPPHLDFPQMMIATSFPLHVSISTSETQPRRQPVFALITSLLRSSVIEQHAIKSPLFIIFAIEVG